MKEVDLNELANVIGGRAIAAATGARRGTDTQMQLALTKLASDIREVARPQQNNGAAMMMMAAVIASRRFA